MFKNFRLFLSFVCILTSLFISSISFAEKGNPFIEFFGNPNGDEFHDRVYACGWNRYVGTTQFYDLASRTSIYDDGYGWAYNRAKEFLKGVHQECIEKIRKEMNEEKIKRKEQKRLEKERSQQGIQEQINTLQKQLIDLLLNSSQSVVDPAYVQQLEILKKKVAILELELKEIKSRLSSSNDL